jgi:hypothetical protein
MYCAIAVLSFPQYLTNAQYLINSNRIHTDDSQYLDLHRVSLQRRMWNKTVHEDDKEFLSN